MKLVNTCGNCRYYKPCACTPDCSVGSCVKNDDHCPHLRKECCDLFECIPSKPSWDDYYLGIMNAVSARASCDRGRTACVLVRDNQILSTGYAGSPPGEPECDTHGHLLEKTTHLSGDTAEHCVRTIHAEQNAICQAAKNGISIKGATCYIRMTPCYRCAMMLVSCGIVRVYCEQRYHSAYETEVFFARAGVDVQYKSNHVLQYDEVIIDGDLVLQKRG